jgi:hypothetical protein
MPEEQEERRIVTEWQLAKLEKGSLVWSDLELAPKHTDEEYDELKKRYDRLEAGRSLNAITRILEGEHVEEWLELERSRDELKAKLDAMDGLLEAASETAIVNGVRMEKAELRVKELEEFAPKHTDEEYDELTKRYDSLHDDFCKVEMNWKDQQVRIKELVQSKRVNEYEWKCKELKVALRNLDESEARIKELEVQADNCPVCGTVRRVEELRAKERAKKPRRFPELDKLVPQNIDDKPEG